MEIKDNLQLQSNCSIALTVGTENPRRRQSQRHVFAFGILHCARLSPPHVPGHLQQKLFLHEHNASRGFVISASAHARHSRELLRFVRKSCASPICQNVLNFSSFFHYSQVKCCRHVFFINVILQLLQLLPSV